MIPSKRLLGLLGVWMALALCLSVIRVVLPVIANPLWEIIDQYLVFVQWAWWSGGGIVVAAVFADIFLSRASHQITLERELPQSLSLGSSNLVQLRIDNPLRYPVSITVCDSQPDHLITSELPVTVVIPAQKPVDIHYRLYPSQRGDARFEAAYLRISSRLGFWQQLHRSGQQQTVKVYPDFATISQFEKLGLDQQTNQLGIHVTQRRGQGMDFHQLREFREGDPLRQVDWKATARMKKLISRQYQDERDQDIVFLLDCGRRLRAKDGALSHFDHCLNALLLTAYLATRQGDAVGLMTFAGPARWYKPAKGHNAVNNLLNQVYDLHSTTDTSDFLSAAESLMERHRKRSLIILMTNVREEDASHLTAAVKLLTKRHLVMVVSLKEQFLVKRLQQPVESFEDALGYSGCVDYFQRRDHILQTLRDSHVLINDSLPENMHINLANQYLQLKRSGKF